jgi:hypothetical protein
MGFKLQYYQAARKILTMTFNGTVVCNKGPAVLHTSCDAWLVMLNSELHAVPALSVLAINGCKIQVV